MDTSRSRKSTPSRTNAARTSRLPLDPFVVFALVVYKTITCTCVCTRPPPPPRGVNPKDRDDEGPEDLGDATPRGVMDPKDRGVGFPKVLGVDPLDECEVPVPRGVNDPAPKPLVRGVGGGDDADRPLTSATLASTVWFWHPSGCGGGTDDETEANSSSSSSSVCSPELELW